MKIKLFLQVVLILFILSRPSTGLIVAQTPASATTSPLPLSAYPRPKNDNGLGIHWSTNAYSQDNDVTDYFVAEIKAMGIKWVKFLNDQTEGRQYDYLIEQLAVNDIMPIMRIYIECNVPLNLASLGRLVDYYVPKGLYYYELYNEPDIRGRDGGWCDEPNPDPEYLARIWAPAAREIIAQGGYPSLPSIFPVGKNILGWEDSFFQRFLRAIKLNNDVDVLYRAWGAVHNYHINHPPDYPQDEVNLTGRLLTAQEIADYHLNEAQVRAINEARSRQFEPGGYYVGNDPTLDVTGFRQFIGYHDQFLEFFGFEIPLISTEGGATVGSCEDPRYPCVDEQLQMTWTLAVYEYMLDKAPEYYFASNTWLIAQKALDYFGGTVWESNAWYHDRRGDYLPIVEALKNHRRKGEARWDQPQVAFSIINTKPSNRLSQYPRPLNDNGRGIHYAPTTLAQPPEVVDYFVDELLEMNMKWVKVMQGDIPKIEHQYLMEQLVHHDMEPIVRIYKPYNEPYQYLVQIVGQAQSLGIHYFELYNEPNIAGFPGGWKPGETINVDYILDLWIPAAEMIQRAGGYPGLPSLTPGGDYDDLHFLGDFLDGLIERERTDLLDRAWIPLHNYFLNHPIEYPYDQVNLLSTPLQQVEVAQRGLTPNQAQSINEARRNAHQPGGFYVGDTIHEDSNGFRKFEAYAALFYDRFGYYIPIISTEGGAIAGDNQDPRYPPVTDADVTSLTLSAYQAMVDNAPDYYFAFTPWLLANQAGGHWDAAWESAAWYKLDGSHLPVVDTLKADSRRYEVRTMHQPYLSELSDPQKQEAVSAALADAITPLSTETIAPLGQDPNWKVGESRWSRASNQYGQIYIDLRDTYGRPASTKQVRVEWSNGWTLLITDAKLSPRVSFPIVSPSDVYVISIAGENGQAIRAKGAEGYNLYVTFYQTKVSQ